MIPNKKILILMSILTLSRNSNAQNVLCLVLKKDVADIAEKTLRVTSLLKKNKTLYDEYKDDISKKIKVTSNIIVLTAKLEEANLKAQELKDKCMNKGCLECQ